MSEMSELKEILLPEYAILKSPIRECKNIPPEAKIYFGELVVLSNKFGYCFAFDEQLAKMKGVSIKTIERWNMLLEKEGFIRRDTKSVPCTMENKDKFKWKRKRKIFIFENPSNNFTEPLNSEGIIEPLKNEGFIEPLKNEGYKGKPSKGKEINNNAVVVFSCLLKLEIPDDLRRNLMKYHDEEKLELAVKRTLAWKTRASDAVGLSTVLSRWDLWVDNEDAEDLSRSNKGFLDHLIHYDNKVLQGVRIVVGESYIEFSGGMKCEVLSISDRDFKIDVIRKFEKLGVEIK